MSAPDVVYLCKSGRNEELRYSLRSLANLPHGDVWLVGGRPDWYRGNYLPTPQAGTKRDITHRSTRFVCSSDEISDPFLYFNDDFYVMTSGGPVPPLHRGTIRGLVDSLIGEGYAPERSVWLRGMIETERILEGLGYASPLSYELHVPMLIGKAAMSEALDLGPHPRSIYGNIAGVGGRQIDDVKITSADDPIPAGRWLSTNDATFYRVERRLRTRFPNPSPWERQ